MIDKFKKMKAGQEKITMLTAYDFQMARILDEAEVDIILVGDSLGMVFQGADNTRGVTVEHICYHTKAVAKAINKAFLIADMPFQSYETPATAVENGRKFLECGAQAVKIEGNPNGALEALVEAGIPVMAHVGLLPQTAQNYKVQGKEATAAGEILESATAMERSGAFSVLIECVPEQLGKQITETVSVPTIGIGAGQYCDGQVLVINDLLHMGERKYAKFVKHYVDLYEIISSAVSSYIREVKSSEFPDATHTYH